MKITQEELGRLRGLIYEATKNGNSWNPTLLRRVVDQLKLDLSFLEEPHPNDESLRNALTMLFISLGDGLIIQDRALFRDAIQYLRKTLSVYND